MKLKYLNLCVLFIFLQNCTQTKKVPSGEANSKSGFYTSDDFEIVEKIDAHVHIDTDQPTFIEQARDNNFRLITINYDDENEGPSMEKQQEFAIQQLKAFPNQIAYITTFSIRDFNADNWLEQTFDYLKNSFSQGAIGIKIYKVIGMSLEDKDGKLVMIDDPRFDPLIDFIVKNNVPVVGHLGEPRNCWLPIERMTINGDKNYFKKHPEYHMYLYPEFPSYEAQIAARDHMLENHPDLKFVGAHLGSLEWSIDELAKRLDQFPNMAVDMAARVDHLEFQSVKSWQKVHDFMIKYQNRLLYGTDLCISSTSNPEALKNKILETWVSDWKFFTTNDEMSVPDFNGKFKGLRLPKEVIDKIYRENAEKWFPGINNGNKK